MQRLIIRIVVMAVAVGLVAFYQHRKEEEERLKLIDEPRDISPNVIQLPIATPPPLPAASGPVPSGTPLVATPAPAPALAPAQ